MKNNTKENILEHTGEVCLLSHILGVIGNKVYGKNLNIEKILLYALYHESSEVLTGDLPTPIKYHNVEIMKAYKQIEECANEKLITMLPQEFQDYYKNILMPNTNSYESKLVKGADKLSALIKCIEEIKSGNKEFEKAKISIEIALDNLQLEELTYFKDNFLNGYTLTLDELN